MIRPFLARRAFPFGTLLLLLGAPLHASDQAGDSQDAPFIDTAAAAPDTERRIVKIVPIEGEAPAPSALVMVRDAETGKLRAPSAAERAELAPTLDPLNRSDAGLVEIHYSDGTVAVHLQGRFQSVSMLHRHGDRLVTTCSHDPQHVIETLTGTNESAPSQEASNVR